MEYVIDYVRQPAQPQAIRAAGVVGVCRYIAPAAWGWPKALTPPEAAALSAAGLPVLHNYEKGTADWQGGTQAGIQAGTAIRTAMAELARPIDVPVFVSYDSEIAPASFPLAAAFHLGVISQAAGRPIDAYAEGAFLEYLVGRGLAKRGWESESTSFPGSGAPTAHTVLRQVYGRTIPGLGGSYDVNEVHAADWGQFPRPSAAPTSVTTTEVSNMRLVPQRARVHHAFKGRDPFIDFDPASKMIKSFNGIDFKLPGATVAIPDPPPNGHTEGQDSVWHIIKAFGIVIAILKLPTNGALDIAESQDGTCLIVTADGDGGTFRLPYADVGPWPGGGTTDVQIDPTVLSAAIIEEVKKHVRVSMTVQ